MANKIAKGLIEQATVTVVILKPASPDMMFYCCTTSSYELKHLTISLLVFGIHEYVCMMMLYCCTISPSKQL